ncbi:hypothetical protein H4Q26_002665 [Puccinia striiformis f. sp. tritici PST-130]|nr:hypothetical protein H4Q26_002665 [Puccinia striiformis f. sp. tritici PST-130]
MLVTLIRHGQRYTINGLGIQQAIQTGKFLHQSQIRFDQIWSSDLQRAHKTASLISEQIDQPPSIQIDQRLRERGQRVNSKSAEPAHSVLSRLLEFWNQVIINSPSHHHILILSHGGALRSLIESDYINDPTFANCSITTVEIDSSDHNKIIQIANVDHLTHITSTLI